MFPQRVYYSHSHCISLVRGGICCLSEHSCDTQADIYRERTPDIVEDLRHESIGRCGPRFRGTVILLV